MVVYTQAQYTATDTQVNRTYRERHNSPKTAMILFANACSKPYAVMVELKDTFITVMAVPCTRWLQKDVGSKS
jgi:Ser-tRNA(Ala) deacylase AlaX